MAGDQLVGDVPEVHAGHLRLTPDVEERIPGPQDKRSLPTGRDGTQVSQVWQATRQSREGWVCHARATDA